MGVHGVGALPLGTASGASPFIQLSVYSRRQRALVQWDV